MSKNEEYIPKEAAAGSYGGVEMLFRKAKNIFLGLPEVRSP